MKKKVLLISFSVFLLDQFIKYFVKLFLMSELIIIPSFFSLYKTHNYGAAFSLFSGQTYFIILISIFVIIFLCKYMRSFKVNKRNIVAFGLVFGGIFGNIFDRLYLGYVIDYLKFNFINYTFPIFNLADVALCLGIGLLVVAVLKKEDEYENCSRK